MPVSEYNYYSLEGVTSTGAGRVLGGGGFRNITVQVEGIGTGTVAVEVSNDGNTWYADPGVTPLTSDGIEECTPGYRYYRANCTVYSAGTIYALFHAND